MADEAGYPVLTKEMIDKLKFQLDGMEGTTISADGPVIHRPGADAAWYIAYKTTSLIAPDMKPGEQVSGDDVK